MRCISNLGTVHGNSLLVQSALACHTACDMLPASLLPSKYASNYPLPAVQQHSVQWMWQQVLYRWQELHDQYLP